jgi:hypothetical protein
MPIPTPNADETESEFIGRCMAESKMLAEYPEAAQRYAVCKEQINSFNTSQKKQ